MSQRKLRELGSIYTPSDYAQFLTSWAIQKPEDKILDVGIGEGVFAFMAYNQLIELGAYPNNASSQLYGAEIDNITYNKFLQLTEDLNIEFPNLYNANFFDIDFPNVDAIVGNPPYVRRTYIENVDCIRQRVIHKNRLVNEDNLPRLTDLYIYFLLYASAILRVGGKLAVITADSWLNVGYGQGFKEYLLQNFRIESLISLDRRVFNDAQVKPVLMLATKTDKKEKNWYTYFIRLKNGFPISSLQKSSDLEIPDLISSKIRSTELGTDKPWGIHFKAPEIYQELASHPLMIPISNLAETRIGVQTLAKEFFVLTPEQANGEQIEEEYLEPLAQSLRYFNEPIIDFGTQPDFYIFYCSKGKEELKGTKALGYILRGETKEVEVRGKNTSVVGYHNKDRIKRSGRKYWYDLKTTLERRGRAEILIPRLIYRNFSIVWNRADFVPGELFIEFLPLPLQEVDTEVYLAILTSLLTEIMLRVHAQVYGGGTYNINPGQIKNVPMLNVNLLANEDKKDLKQAYLQYLKDKSRDRSMIDVIIYRIFGFDKSKRQKLKEVLEDLHLIATSSKKVDFSANP